ncbi:YggS family pyridoxal phosphate-dependent enzyme [Prosthecomicrobium hirschii]|uniref:YggS family pyridoxal phosphate-dependent enzyme n=1 Tax=Prosthecodimorpha hirschii TaxID=665126 RepID=UPI00222026B9|nr:YggS family pyridoxal phosphate-dependent enzyme [Prosthecomicrobium hirschii]MCW1842124.1 YggS family pyridoxal phosphate-dependent enzyme [Prosthecomicrobium hirschii]
MSAADRLAEIRHRIRRTERATGRPEGAVTLVAVSKTFPAEEIAPVIAAGQRVFGENRVQEAKAKWPGLKAATPEIELHLIGPLQSNKAREAVELFDVIHTVDRDRIAEALAAEMRRQGRTPKLLVQVNTGLEPQKAGIDPRETAAFVERCRSQHGLTIAGLMCIPPAEDAPGPHFALLAKLGQELALPLLSMGMSSDFETAIGLGATHVRVGSAIFGHRDYGETPETSAA